MRSNSVAASVAETECLPASIALLPDDKKPPDISPIPQRANPAARKIRKIFIIGDLAPSLIDRNMGLSLLDMTRP